MADSKVVNIKDWRKKKAEDKKRKAEAKIVEQMKALDW